MKTTTVLGALLLAPVLLLTGCGSDAPEAPTTTVGALRDLTGVVSIDEAPFVPVDEQAARSDVVVAGPVVDITDVGPADSAGSVTHVFRITVKVQDALKGAAAGSTVDVTTLGVGDAARLRRSLDNGRGLWLLKQVEGVLVPVQSTGVLFEQGGAVVAPLAEAGETADVATLDEAVELARRGSQRATARR